MSDTDPTPIPEAVLAALRTPWRMDAWDSVFAEILASDPARLRDPSAYNHFASGSDLGEGIPDADAIAMVRAGVFGRHGRDHGDSVQINEHAEHAFMDFANAVYAAWAEFERRLSTLPVRPRDDL